MPYNRTSPWKWADDREFASANYREWCAENAPELRAKLKEVAQKVVREAFAKADEVGGLSYLTRQQYARHLDPLLACASPPLTWDQLIRLSGVSKRWKPASIDLEPDLASEKQQRQFAKIVWTHEKLLDKRLLDWNHPLANRSRKRARSARQVVVARLCRSMAEDVLRAGHHHKVTSHFINQLIDAGYTKSVSHSSDPSTMLLSSDTEHRKPSLGRPLVWKAAGSVADDLLLQPHSPWLNGPILLLAPAATGGGPRNELLKQWAWKWVAYQSEHWEEPILCLMDDVGLVLLKWLAKKGIDWIWFHELSSHIDLDRPGTQSTQLLSPSHPHDRDSGQPHPLRAPSGRAAADDHRVVTEGGQAWPARPQRLHWIDDDDDDDSDDDDSYPEEEDLGQWNEGNVYSGEIYDVDADSGEIILD